MCAFSEVFVTEISFTDIIFITFYLFTLFDLFALCAPKQTIHSSFSFGPMASVYVARQRLADDNTSGWVMDAQCFSNAPLTLFQYNTHSMKSSAKRNWKPIYFNEITGHFSSGIFWEAA